VAGQRRLHLFICEGCGRRDQGRKGRRFCTRRCRNAEAYARHAERRERYARERALRPGGRRPARSLAPEVLPAIASAPADLSTAALARRLGLAEQY
jgi:hypothetical protein